MIGIKITIPEEEVKIMQEDLKRTNEELKKMLFAFVDDGSFVRFTDANRKLHTAFTKIRFTTAAWSRLICSKKEMEGHYKLKMKAGAFKWMTVPEDLHSMRDCIMLAVEEGGTLDVDVEAYKKSKKWR